MNSPRARVIAFYLPQYHPIPENDAWWGRGFTEWTNVAAGKALFRGHEQPRLPSDLGFYDLRVPEVRQAQADLATGHGIEGFAYWHYWFAGKRLLQRPFEEVLASGRPDYPFCLAWANQSWTGIWHGAPDRVLQEQTYPGVDDYENHFRAVMPAMADHRYLTVEGRPVFFVYRPTEIPDAKRFSDTWRELAQREGLPGLHLVGMASNGDWNPLSGGFDASLIVKLGDVLLSKTMRPSHRARRLARRRPSLRGLEERFFPRPVRCSYEKILPQLLVEEELAFPHYPGVVANWDNTPRSGRGGFVLTGTTPTLFARHLLRAVERVQVLPADHRIIGLKSWNEWAEGNYVEPDRILGRGYLEAIRDVVTGGAALPESPRGED